VFRLFDLLAATLCLIQKQSSGMGSKIKKFYLFSIIISNRGERLCGCHYKVKCYFKGIRAGKFHGLNM